MFSKKKTECRVCGYRFTPERENIYTAEEPRSMADMLTKAPTRFSAVDCPICGCQIALAIRVPRVDMSDNAERHDADALNIPASPYPDGDKGVMACPNCGSGEYLHNADENENAFCGQCGQAIRNARFAAHILTAAKSANAAQRKSKRRIRRNTLAGLRNRTLKAAGNARLIIRTKPSNVAKIALLQKKPIEREGKRQ